jgi:hypothetical protein
MAFYIDASRETGDAVFLDENIIGDHRWSGDFYFSEIFAVPEDHKNNNTVHLLCFLPICGNKPGICVNAPGIFFDSSCLPGKNPENIFIYGAFMCFIEYKPSWPGYRGSFYAVTPV